MAFADLQGEVEWIIDGSITSTIPFAVRVWNDIIKGDEGVPTPGTPAYPTPAELQALLDNKAPIAAPEFFRLNSEGGLQLFNPDTGTWHTLVIRGLPGAESLQISAPIP